MRGKLFNKAIKHAVQFIFVLVLVAHAADKINMAILDFDSFGSVSRGDVQIITERFQTELINTKQFSVLERTKINSILQEQGFQSTGACTNSNCQVEVGQLLGVDQMITGSVGKLGNLYTVNLKVINVSSGEIILSKAADYEEGLEEVLTKGCKALANSFVLSNNADATNDPQKTDSEEKPENKIDEESDGIPVGWWVASGIVVTGAVLTYLFLNTSDDKKTEDTSCLGDC